MHTHVACTFFLEKTFLSGSKLFTESFHFGFDFSPRGPIFSWLSTSCPHVLWPPATRARAFPMLGATAVPSRAPRSPQNPDPLQAHPGVRGTILFRAGSVQVYMDMSDSAAG